METKVQPKEQENSKKSEPDFNHGEAQTASRNKSDVLDLSDFIAQLWKDKMLVLWTSLVSLLIGLLIAILSPVEYESEILLLPQSVSEQGKGLGFLQQFGVSFGGGGADMSSISTTLYPEVVKSTPYLLQLADQKIPVASRDSSVTITTYFNSIAEKPPIEDVKKYTIGLPKLILSWPVKIIESFKEEEHSAQDENAVVSTYAAPSNTSQERENTSDRSLPPNRFDVFEVSPQKNAAIGQLRQRVSVEVKANGIVSVSAKMPEPQAAAALTALSVNYLTDYITQYRTEKVKQNLDFIEQQYEDSEKKFLQAQRQLASFRDRNQNMVTERARAELERLQTEYDLHYGIYRSFAQQLEQAKIKLQEETPVFRELEPVKVPADNSEPNTELILIGSLFFGIFLGVGILLTKVFWKSFAQSINFKL